MPRFRAHVRQIAPYVPGRPIADVAAEYGFDPRDIAKLASNENPLPPLDAVLGVMREAVGDVNRYPDDEARQLRAALADRLEVDTNEVWVGGGSSELLRVIAAALGGPGTSAVYAWPSFVIYRLATILALADRIEVPLDTDRRHDVDDMIEGLRDDTTVLYLCNPNNPTGTVIAATEVTRLIDSVPEDVMVVVDEAYHEYVTDPSHRSAVAHAIERPNVIVLRTFSKIHGLAALRVGYGISRSENIVEFRKAQAPFSVTSVGQRAAIESLRHQEALSARARDNALERDRIESALTEMELPFVPSQANFVFFDLGDGDMDLFAKQGLIVRPFKQWVRASVGVPEENDRLIEAVAAIVG